MYERVIFSHKGGLGIIADTKQEVLQLVEPTPVQIVDEQVTPGNLSTISQFYVEPLEYLGILKVNDNLPKCLVFYIGADEKESKHYFKCLYFIHSLRLCDKLSPRSARDIIYKENRWK